MHWHDRPSQQKETRSTTNGLISVLIKPGSSGAVVTNLGVGGDHVGSASEKDAQAIIEKALEEGLRFFGENKGLRRTEVYVKLAIPAVLSLEDVFGLVWSLPITCLVSGMSSVQQVSQNAAIARGTWNWNQTERKKRIDAVAPFAGPDLEFYKG